MNTKPKKQWLAIAAVLIITLVLGAFILMGSKSSGNGEEHAHQESEAGEHKDKGHKDEADKSAKGPHGGKLLRALVHAAQRGVRNGFIRETTDADHAEGEPERGRTRDARAEPHGTDQRAEQRRE